MPLFALPRRRASALLLGGLLLGSEARADDPAEPAVRAEKPAPERTIGALRTAWWQTRSPEAAAELGLAEAKQRSWASAAEHLSIAIEGLPHASAERRSELSRVLAQAKAHVGVVTVTVSVGGAKVVVDGDFVGDAPLDREVFVDPGTRTFEAHRAGFRKASQRVAVAAGGSASVTLRLHPDSPAKPPSRRSPLWLVAGGGLSAAGLGVGIGTALAANGQTSTIRGFQRNLGDRFPYPEDRRACLPPNQSSPDCAGLRDAAEKQATFTNVSVASFVIGGVVGFATLGLWIYDTRPGTDLAVRLAPLGGGDEPGLALSGAW
jgi:hypothetical protein